MGPLPHPHPRALPSPSLAAWERLPGLEHAEFHFSNGAPGARPSSAFVVVKYFGKLRLGFSLKRLSLGKRRRAEQPMQSRRGGERRAAGRIPRGRCWGWDAVASRLGRAGDRSWAGWLQRAVKGPKKKKEVFQGD